MSRLMLPLGLALNLLLFPSTISCLAQTGAWSVQIQPLQPPTDAPVLANGFLRPNSTSPFVLSLAAVRGAVIDAVTHDTVRKGSITLSSTGDRVDLARTGGIFDFGDSGENPALAASLEIVAYPYPVTEVPVRFVGGSARVQNVVIHKLRTAFVAGVVRDSATLQPLKARVTVDAVTLEGEKMYSDRTDEGGNFMIDSLYVSEPPVVTYRRLYVDVPFPWASRTIAPFALDSVGVYLTLDIPRVNLFSVGRLDSGKSEVGKRGKTQGQI